MKAFITGGTGFVGTHLTGRFLDLGWDVVITARSGKSIHQKEERLKIIACDTKFPGAWQQEVAGADAVINLAGKNIFTIWNKKNLKAIEESRLLTTRNLVDALPTEGKAPFLSTSAAGYYGNSGDMLLNEETPNGQGALAELCSKWEAMATMAEEKKCRVSVMRFGIVLGQRGGAFKMMLNPFRFFLGGSLGQGENWVSWIHIDDLASAILFIIENDKISGPVNFCSPNPVKHKGLAKALAEELNRPSFFKIPPFFVKTALGGLGNELLSSQRMTPEKLNKAGFQFKFPDMNAAFADLID